MSVVAWLGVVSAVISIIAFLFAVWVWLRSNAKVNELEGIIQSAYDITGTILWDMQVVHAEDPAARLRNAEKSLGVVSALHTITGKYATGRNRFLETEIGLLLQRGVVWNYSMILDVERSDSTREVWLAMPDLEPDLSDSTTGRLVANNLRKGKRYVYFCPNDLADLEAKHTRLLANIGATKSTRQAAHVTVVPIDWNLHGKILQRGNTVIFFSENPDWEAGTAFEEIVLTGVSDRGMFWQEHAPAVSAQIQSFLKQELMAWRARMSS